MFALSKAQNNPDGLEMTGSAIRSVAKRLAEGKAAAEKKAADNAILAAALGLTGPTAPRGGRKRNQGGRGGAGGGRGHGVSWKKRAAEIATAKQAAIEALQAQIRELQGAHGIPPAIPDGPNTPPRVT